MEKRVLHSAVVATLVLMLSSSAASAATFYVRLDGSDSNTGQTNDSGGAWRTIHHAAGRVAPGDTIRVQAGTYAEAVSPGVAGVAGSPITFVADGAVTFCSMVLSNGKNYLRFIGFTIDTDAGGCVKAPRAVAIVNDSTTIGVEFWNNTIQDANICGFCSGSYGTRMHNWIVIGNTFTRIGCCLKDGDGMSSAKAISIGGNHNIFAYNIITLNDPDEFHVDGTYSYWLNNFVVKTVTDGNHGDVFQAGASSLGLAYNTFEANFIVGEGNVSDEHGALLQSQTANSCSTGTCGAMTENLFRRNVWHNLSGGHLAADTSAAGSITNTREVHGAIVEMQRTAATAGASALLRAGNTGYFLNNLNYKAWGDDVYRNAQVFVADTGASFVGAGYNLAYTPDKTLSYIDPWTSQVNPLTNVNPLLEDVANDNFTLRAGSGAAGAAGALTKTSGAGTGTTFRVVSGGGGFFRGPNRNVAQYGGNLTAGDVITVGTDTVTVVNISGDTITVTPSFTWADGEPVYWGDDTTPDIGAYPYKAGGYTLSATYAASGSTITVTPNDASLVRFVVCYSDGAPYAVDNSSPYNCAAPAGTFSANVYTRYASKTLWVSVGGTQSTTLTAPKNLKLSGS